MSELASYSIQATILALIALITVSRSKKTDLYQVALISVWLVGVIAIYARYGEKQDLFYSNDQQFHIQVITNLIPNNGFSFSSIISQRYLITIPVFVVAQLGFNPLMLFKFIQLFSLLLLYRRGKSYLNQHQIELKYWHLPLFCGSLFVFMSLLGLRDVVLAAATFYFIYPTNQASKSFALVSILLLRPHLAVALVFGKICCSLFLKMKTRFDVLLKSFLILISYYLGSLSYLYADYKLSNKPMVIDLSMFAAKPISQIALNFVGLQFLVLDSQEAGTVDASTMFLIGARLVFIEIFLVPILFLFLFFQQKQCLRKQFAEVCFGMFFFYGLILQNAISTNSTRQNLPLLAIMGFTIVAEISTRNRQNIVLPSQLNVSLYS